MCKEKKKNMKALMFQNYFSRLLTLTAVIGWDLAGVNFIKTFYARLFHRKVLHLAFLYLDFIFFVVRISAHMNS